MLARMSRWLSLLFFAGVAWAGPGRAQPTADPLLPQVQAAIEAAARGEFDARRHGHLAAHPLYRWIEFAALRRDADLLPRQRAEAFLARHRGEAVGEAFREIWLAALARRKDWPAFRAAWSPTITDPALRCAELDARQATTGTDPQWVRDAQALWRSSGRALPPTCDAPFALLAAQGGLPPALRWERIELAAIEGEPTVMRDAARSLPADEARLAEDYAAFLEAVHERALVWPKSARSRLVASHGLARLAKSAPAVAEALLPKYAEALGFDEAARGRVLYQIALWTVASYEPDAARRLAAVPETAYDARLHEWRVREALARADWPAALAAIRKMPPAQRADSRWTYFEARLLELTGERDAAHAAYARAARKPEFHGFLAADRLEQPYALCPWRPTDPPALKAQVTADAGLRRALALHRIEHRGWALREWDAVLARFDDVRRRLAVEVAQEHGWFDRAVFALGKDPAGVPKPDELRLYHLRFPLHHAEVIRREAARHGLDPAWVAAEIRAESVFDPSARSHANALGLMQVLPETGMAVARRLGLPWRGAASLYEPETNIVLGTAYLRQLLDESGAPYLAIAGYNAGPAPLQRWRTQRPGMDPDFWIETISYKETRDYVARVLAFSVIYDWRLNGDALRLSDRLRGRTDGPRKRFVCPLADPATTQPAG